MQKIQEVKKKVIRGLANCEAESSATQSPKLSLKGPVQDPEPKSSSGWRPEEGRKEIENVEWAKIGFKKMCR